MNGGYGYNLYDQMQISPFEFNPYGRMNQSSQDMGGLGYPTDQKLLAPGSPPFTGQMPPQPDLPPGMGIGRPMIVTPQPYNPYGQGPSNPGMPLGPSVPSPQTPTGPTTPASPISDQESNDNFRHFNALQSFQMNGMPLPSWFDMTRANAHLANWANNPNNPANFNKQGR